MICGRIARTMAAEPQHPERAEITLLLEAWGRGDGNAFERLFDLLYPELRRAADRAMRGERAGHTLQPTALVHEAFLELLGQERARFRDRAHFLAVAAFVMRRILAEHARARAAAKRGGGVPAGDLERALTVATPDHEATFEEILAVDQALEHLEALNARAAQVVVLRYFGGLSHEEIGTALDLSERTVKREWTAARAWLRRELGER
jgi:RNA polymerase sigma factor (TIGR02999 family)